jgi:endoglucanase
MYTFHFYAASHRDYHRNGLAQASSSLPLFVTEWGTQLYTGDGDNDFASSNAYITLMAEKKISWTSWNYSDDHRSGAAFKPGTYPNGPWTGESLKEAGAWVRDKMLNPPDDFPTN